MDITPLADNGILSPEKQAFLRYSAHTPAHFEAGAHISQPSLPLHTPMHEPNVSYLMPGALQILSQISSSLLILFFCV
jgi:hypothetical protein